MVGFNEASNPAKQFGSLSFVIFLRVGRLGGEQFRHVPFGADERAYRFSPAFGVGCFAAGQRLVRLVKQAAQPCPALHFNLATGRTQILDRAQRLSANRAGRIDFS